MQKILGDFCNVGGMQFIYHSHEIDSKYLGRLTA